MTAIEPATLTLTLPVTLRPVVQADLPLLEWYGQYRHFRRVFRHAYDEQTLGRRLLLVADVQGFPIGQLFINFHAGSRLRGDREQNAYFYAFRVMEMFRGQGIGSRLLAEAERSALERGLISATIAVAKTNVRARHLYERLGYHLFAEDEGRWQYMDHKGVIRHMHDPCWILEKTLKAV